MATTTDERPPSPKELEEDASWIDAQLLQGALEHEAAILRVGVQRATDKGDNYSGFLFRVNVQYRLSGVEDVRSTSFIVKTSPHGPTQFAEAVGIYKREIIVYNEALPKLYAFADSRLGKNVFKRFSPQYYHVSRPDTLILDDLKVKGFVMAPRRERLDFAHSKLVMENIARLHALSEAYSEQNPNFLSDLNDTFFGDESKKQMMMQTFTPAITNLNMSVKNWTGLEEIAKKVEHLGVEAVVDKVMQVCQPGNSYRNVLAHGDCWINNFLFKYSEKGEPVDFRLVDYQQTRKGSPAVDLTNFLFTSIRADIRFDRLDDLLEAYCAEFDHCARALGYDAPPVGVAALRREVERMAPLGFLYGICVGALVHVDPKHLPDLSRVTPNEMMEMLAVLYQNAAYQKDLEILLPYFDQHGVFD